MDNALNNEPVQLDEEFEKAEQEVMSYLPEMNEIELTALIGELGLEIPADKKGRRALYRFILTELLKIEQDNEDGGKAKYLGIHAFLRTQADRKKEFIDQLMETPVVKQQNRTLPLLPTELGAGHVDINQQGKLFVDEPPKINRAPRATSLVHLKECKIRGSIGDPGEKEKVSYDGLMSQINEKIAEGYDENRIVGAVINAITPGNVFKSRLETQRNLDGSIPLDELLQMLRIHFLEESSQDLMRKMSDLMQENGETASVFCTKLIVLRNQVLSRSLEEGCKIDPGYLRQRFLKSFATGLRNGNIRNELREALKGNPSDNKIQELIAAAVRAETERAGKFSNMKGMEVSAVERERSDFQIREGGRKKEEELANKMTKKMEEMQVQHRQEMGSLRSELMEIKTVFKTGFSNLSNPNPTFGQQPQMYVQPPPPTGSFQPSVANQYSQSSVQSSNPTSNNQYIIPQMRGNNGPRPPPNNSNQGNQNAPGRRRFSGCQNCVNNNNRWCDHCLYCGQSGHQVATCPRALSRRASGGTIANQVPSQIVTPVPTQPAPTQFAQTAALQTQYQPQSLQSQPPSLMYYPQQTAELQTQHQPQSLQSQPPSLMYYPQQAPTQFSPQAATFNPQSYVQPQQPASFVQDPTIALPGGNVAMPPEN